MQATAGSHPPLLLWPLLPLLPLPSQLLRPHLLPLLLLLLLLLLLSLWPPLTRLMCLVLLAL